MNTAVAAPTEIRLVGRGGHGVVTAGELLGRAAILEDCFAQAIPNFGPERRGALSACTLRIGPDPILLKCSSTRPEVVLVLDPTIWQHVSVTVGLPEDGTLVFNSARSPEEIREALLAGPFGAQLGPDCRIFCVDATSIAMQHLGRPITNTAMMGALSGATPVPSLASIERVLEERFGNKAKANAAAARAARDGLRALGD